MGDFTYTVFVIVASMIGWLVGLFATGVIGVLIYDSHRRLETDEPAELSRAA